MKNKILKKLEKFGVTRFDGRVRPRVGLTGSFGRGNYGDELYIENYKYWLGGWADLHLLTGLPMASYLREFGDSRVDLMDSVVLGGGDLLCPYRTKVDRDFIHPSYLRRPLHVAGIGVERNKDDKDPDVVEKWRKFLKNSNVKSLSTRDEGSKSWIEENIQPSVNVESHPDLVCALPLPSVKRPNGRPILGLVTRHIKHPKEYVLMAEVARRYAERGWHVRHIIGGVGGHGQKDFENAKLLEVPEKETFFSQNLDDISRSLGECSLVLSMKLHTTLVATMYGVPTISVNPVVKAREFMKSIGRESLVVRPTDEKLLSIVDGELPEVPMDKVERLRKDASSHMEVLSQRVWDDFRFSSFSRKHQLPEKPFGR